MEKVRIADGFCLNKEGVHFEAKEAKNGIPKDAWDTYSAFANTDGGTIVFGLEECDGGLKVAGVPDAEGRVGNIWNLLNDREFVSSNLLTNSDLRIMDCDGAKLIVMDVPRADRMDRPVYTHNNPRNTFRRNGEGDYKCTMEEITAMIVDSSRTATDLSVVRTSRLEDLSRKTIESYRNSYRVLRPESEWNGMDDDSFLRILGAAAYDGDMLRPTFAGLLMFGVAYTISFETNGYCLDYREYDDDRVDWTDRFMSDDGGWSGNLFDFYTECCRRIRRTLKHGMSTGRDLRRIDDSSMDKVFREALLNAVANADYHLPGGVVVERRPDTIRIHNPGTFRIPLERAEEGGTSDPRNPTILKMFNLIGFGERAGSGIPRMTALCIGNGMPRPRFEERNRPDRVTVTIAAGGLERSRSMDDAILDMIRRDPQVSISSMSEELGVDRNTVSRAIGRMKASGLIERIGGTRGVWRIASRERSGEPPEQLRVIHRRCSPYIGSRGPRPEHSENHRFSIGALPS